jgi:hypothetical protein
MEWINVNDRLPDSNGYYIAACISPYREPGLIHYHAATGWQNGFYKVTHWMPLPKLPTEIEN